MWVRSEMASECSLVSSSGVTLGCPSLVSRWHQLHWYSLSNLEWLLWHWTWNSQRVFCCQPAMAQQIVKSFFRPDSRLCSISPHLAHHCKTSDSGKLDTQHTWVVWIGRIFIVLYNGKIQGRETHIPTPVAALVEGSHPSCHLFCLKHFSPAPWHNIWQYFFTNF